MRTLILFVDTNIFLQCQPLEQLSWAQHFSADRIEILIPAAVQDEIDRQKNEGDSRRGRRARDTNSLFNRVLNQLPQPLTICPSGPEVVLAFAPPLPRRRETPETLDPTHPDDSIIEEALRYPASADLEVQIATNDTGMRLRATRHHVATFSIPGTWLMPPEADERERRIRALESEVSTLRRREPVLTIEAGTAGVRTIERLAVNVERYAPLTADELHQLEASVRVHHPVEKRPSDSAPADPATAAVRAALAVLEANDEQVKEYEDRYEQWLAKARKAFERLEWRLNLRAGVVPLLLRLENTGSVPADEMLLEVFASEGLVLCVAPEEELPPPIELIDELVPDIVLEAPPRLPRDVFNASWAASLATVNASLVPPNLHTQLDAMARSIRPVHRDRHRFYLREDDAKPLKQWSLECGEFRHGVGAKQIRLWVIVPPDGDVTGGHLYCRISARNLSTSVQLRIPVEISFVERSTREAAQRWRCRSQAT